MDYKGQKNFRILPETRDRVRKMADMTFRSESDLIDWIVSEAYKKMFSEEPTETKEVTNVSPTAE
ncbi:MAG: hypothetical protein C0391_03760 [Anaerolinea sp.]|nr:hypothetical protein [Anaerolinea sp.]